MRSELDGLSCASAAACLAVGDSDRGVGDDDYSSHQRALAEWWDGTRWTMLPTP
ncbi:MAG TPA: hypothetical protein VHY58_01860 [Streptosporangiaceae bacterium]|jgi:hypothetical protein|nr:hypothetical protein [Streptosporangiaceae bacterium]